MTLRNTLYPLLSLGWVAAFYLAFAGQDSVDLMALYVAAAAVAQGKHNLVYLMSPDFLSVDAPTAMLAFKETIGLTGHPTVPYIYPPLWAWLLAPITEMTGPITFVRVAMALQLAMLAGCIGLAWRVMRLPRVEFLYYMLFCFAVLTLGTPAKLIMLQNQPQIATFFLVLLAFERYRAGHFATAGGVLALAAALKVSPLFFALIFILDRNWRATAAFALVGGALGGLSIFLAGWPMHAEFLSVLSKISDLVVLEKVNYSLEMLIFQFQQIAAGTLEATGWNMLNTVTAPKPFWLKTLSSAFMLASLAALILMRPRLVASTAVPVLLLGFSLTIALFGALSWAHYFVLPMLLLPSLFLVMERSLATIIIAATFLLQLHTVFRIGYALSTQFYVTSLIGVVTFGALLLILNISVFRATRFEPDVPLHFR